MHPLKSTPNFETPAPFKLYGASPSPRMKVHPPPSTSSLIHATQRLLSSPKAISSPSENSVVVFGFPATRREEVLSKFRKTGNIVDIQFSEGNWMVITFSKRSESGKALSINGQVIVENIMIGVKPASTDDVFIKDRGIARAPVEDFIHSSYYIRRTPRRYSPIWENFIMYFFNLD